MRTLRSSLLCLNQEVNNDYLFVDYDTFNLFREFVVVSNLVALKLYFSVDNDLIQSCY